jgi:hypothetical protein
MRLAVIIEGMPEILENEQVLCSVKAWSITASTVNYLEIPLTGEKLINLTNTSGLKVQEINVDASYSDPLQTTYTDLENFTCLNLAQGINADYINDITTDNRVTDSCGNIYYSNTFMSDGLYPDIRQHLVVNNATLETPNFSMLLEYYELDPSLTVIPTYVDVSNSLVEKDISLLTDSTIYYNAHLKFEVTDNNSYFDGQDWSVLFDNTDVDYNLSKAVNSTLNIKNGNPIFVNEYTSFNENYALGQSPTSYFADSSNGDPTVTSLTDNLLANNFDISINQLTDIHE